jgi:DnaJ-class molecular chaperone
MINYYQILDVKKSDNLDKITKKYNKKIMKFKNLPFLSSEQKDQVRNLKIALYILSNNELKKLYDNYLDSLTITKVESEVEDIQNYNMTDKYVSLNKKDMKDKDNKYLTDRLFSIKVNQNLNLDNESRLRS